MNLLAFTGFPERGGAQVDFIPDNDAAFRRAARKAVFQMQGGDRPGALTAMADKLAKARINLIALDAVTAGNKRFGAIFWVKKKDVARTSRLLKAR